LGESERGLSCQILNEEEIRLKYDKRVKTLTGDSKNPIIIQNNNLNYLMTVDLESFKAIYSNVSKNKKRTKIKHVFYNSANQYKSINNLRKEEIQTKRIAVYRGSTLHFMRSLAEQKLKKEGYEVFLAAEQELKKEGYEVFLAKGHQIRNINQYLKVLPYLNQGVKVEMKNKMNILFEETRESSIECSTGVFYIDKFGNHAPSKLVVFTGDLGNQRMGDTLPLDFNLEDLQ
jgi:hypothetical protein